MLYFQHLKMKLITVIFGTVLCAALYHQVLGDGVTKCYVCEFTDTNCENPKKTKCDDAYPAVVNGTWTCLTTTVSVGGVNVTTKQCAPKNKTEEVCQIFSDSIPEGGLGMCSICYQDLCNSENGNSDDGNSDNDNSDDNNSDNGNSDNGNSNDGNSAGIYSISTLFLTTLFLLTKFL